MSSSSDSSKDDEESAPRIARLLLDYTVGIFETLKKTHVPNEMLQVAQVKLAAPEARNDYLQDKIDTYRIILDPYLDPTLSVPPPRDTVLQSHGDAAAERLALLALPHTSNRSYSFPPFELHLSVPSLLALCSKDQWLHDDVLDIFSRILAMEVCRPRYRGMGHKATISSTWASDVFNFNDGGGEAEMNRLIIMLARSGFSWELTKHFLYPFRPPAQDQWLLVWVDIESKKVTIYNTAPDYVFDYDLLSLNTISLLSQHCKFTLGIEIPAQAWTTVYYAEYADKEKNNSGVHTCILAEMLAFEKGLGQWSADEFSVQAYREHILGDLMNNWKTIVDE